MLGIGKYNSLFERKRLLQNIYDGSIKIKETIRVIHSPLHESFLMGGDFFKSASEKIGKGLLPEDAVNESMAEFPSLKEDDKRIISRFARGLNAQDFAGQISNLELFSEDIKRNISHATQELDTKGRLYVKGSILCAMAIVLLLI